MLAKVAVGALVAKGVGKVVKGGMNRGGNAGAGGGLGGLGGLLGGAAGGGGLGSLIGAATGGGGGGGLAGGLGQILSGGGQQQQQQQGGSGGLGGLLESLGGAQQQGGGGGLGDLLNSALQGGQPSVDPSAEAQAEVLIRAMLNAAKADGQIDASEQQKITENLDGIDDDEAEFIRTEMNAPLDFDAFVRSIPNGMEQQVYLMSLMAIDLDSQSEAQYLDKLARNLNISQQASNQIHSQLGVPQLYG